MVWWLNIRSMGRHPLDAPLTGSKMTHGPTDQKTVMQHPNRFWTLTCFDDSHWLLLSLDLKPKLLVSLWNYLSIHMWIVENGAQMRPGWPVYVRLVLEVEADSKSCWTGPSAFVGRPCWSSLPPYLPPSSSWLSPIFLRNITSLGSSLFSKVWKGSLKNELTSKFSSRIRARVIGPCILFGASTGASEGVMSSSGW